ncbi:hypothetical protein OUZ56_005486 [Daphnia magna]|uniref:Uncharacterized protein n=1 Tax=Daphnia magna TaxID=35525 RepID=A0ABQ9YT46_9CRUS|nr:hypothetical protein OUZ56_005486 [Daphnia magna]
MGGDKVKKPCLQNGNSVTQASKRSLVCKKLSQGQVVSNRPQIVSSTRLHPASVRNTLLITEADKQSAMIDMLQNCKDKPRTVPVLKSLVINPLIIHSRRKKFLFRIWLREVFFMFILSGHIKCLDYSRKKSVRMSFGCLTALSRVVQTKKNDIRRTSNFGLSGGCQQDIRNIQPRHLVDIRRTDLCYVG